MRTLENPNLSAADIAWLFKTGDSQCITLSVDDIGGANTITVTGSDDGVTYTNYTAIYKFDAAGVMSANGGATIAANGRFLIDVNGKAYIKIAVTTYAAGVVKTRAVEGYENIHRGVYNMIATGLTAQGTTQAAGWPIRAQYNVFSVVAAGANAATLPAGLGLDVSVAVKNTDSADDMTVFPPVGGSINGGTVNAGFTVVHAATPTRFVSDGAGNFWTF
jgi:hypothetical protein